MFVLVGFFVGWRCQFKGNTKNLTETKTESVSEEESLKRKRELQEYYNMMTYDGTVQDKID